MGNLVGGDWAAVPAPAQEHAELPERARLHELLGSDGVIRVQNRERLAAEFRADDFLHVEPRAQLGHELVGRKAVQVFHHALVRPYLQLGVGEEHGQEIVGFLGRLRRPARHAAGLRDLRGGGYAMVAVGDVHAPERVEPRGDRFGELVGNSEAAVAHAVVGREIEQRLAAFHLFVDPRELFVEMMGQEYGAGLRLAAAHVVNAVDFLVDAGRLVLLHDAVQVVVDGHATHEAVLHAAIHREFVQVKRRFVVDREIAARLLVAQHASRLQVHEQVEGVGALREVHDRLVDCQERPRVRGHDLARFLDVLHVVGKRRHVGCRFARRAHGLERPYGCHALSHPAAFAGSV